GNVRRPATRRFLEGRLLENPTFREMNLLCVRCSEKAALSFSKTILDSFFSILPLRYEYREFDAAGRTLNRSGLDTPGCRPVTRIWKCSWTRLTGQDASASSPINSAACRSNVR